MYRAVELIPSDCDLHRFVWRNSIKDSLVDCRMTRVTFGVSASSFAANMAVKQNATDFASEFPLAAKVVDTSFYVDDCLTGANTTLEAITLHTQLHDLFSKAGFLLRKWHFSDPEVMEQITHDLREVQEVQSLPTPDQYIKTLGVEWNSRSDHFRLTVASLPPLGNITKRALISDIAKIFDVLGWFSPAVIKGENLVTYGKRSLTGMMLCQILSTTSGWSGDLLHLLSTKHIPRCYFDKKTQLVALELHGFSDASENAYAAAVYLRMTDTFGLKQVSLISSKTKVAPIKTLTIPRLELCGA